MINFDPRERKDGMAWFLALAALVLGLDFEEETTRLHVEMGMAYMSQGLLERAEAEFATALESGVSCPEAFLGLGMIKAKKGDLVTAAGFLREFMSRSPEDHRGPLELGRILLSVDSSQAAHEMASKAYLLAPSLPDTWLLMARTSIACRDSAQARQWLLKTVDDGGEQGLEARVMLGSLMRAADELHQAREVLIPAAQADYPPAYWGLARVYLAWEDYMRASDNINRYLYLSPDGPWSDSARLILDELASEGLYITESWSAPE